MKDKGWHISPLAFLIEFSIVLLFDNEYIFSFQGSWFLNIRNLQGWTISGTTNTHEHHKKQYIIYLSIHTLTCDSLSSYKLRHYLCRKQLFVSAFSLLHPFALHQKFQFITLYLRSCNTSCDEQWSWARGRRMLVVSWSAGTEFFAEFLH